MISPTAEYTFIVNNSSNLVANFSYVPQVCTITVSANPTEGGTVSGDGNYLEGISCTVHASANAGYDFFAWKENGNIVSTEADYTFVVNASRNLVAYFDARIVKVSIAVDPEGCAVVTGAGSYHYGDQVTLNVIPEANYLFQNWTENGSIISANTTHTFTITGDRNFVAHLLHVESVDEHDSNTIVLYPNPVNDRLTVEATEAIHQIEIYNITGAMVFSQKNGFDKVEIHTADLSAGTYVIRMTTQNAVEVRRFVKK